jgi:alpha-ketoglutarate-dependent taurine dioxygenase
MYDRLSPAWKRFADSLTATYKSTALYGYAQKDPEGMDAGPRGAPNNTGLEFENKHPVVRTHPLTGWKSVFATGTNCLKIDDVTDAESKQIMDKFMDLITQNHDLTIRFRWNDLNDVAVWDNRCTFHAATQDHFGKGTRIGWRCMTMGEVPFHDVNSRSRNDVTGGWPYNMEGLPAA